MTSFNNPKQHDQIVSPNQNPSHQTDLSDGLTQRSTPPAQNSYQDGYWQGRYSERQRQAEQRAYEEESASSGVILGLLLASLIGLGLGTYFFLSGQNRTPQVEPSVMNPVPAPNQSPQVRERIIERDRVVPVPQAAPDTPDVNVTIPNPVPVPESRVPQPAPAAPAQTTPPQAPAQSGQ